MGSLAGKVGNQVCGQRNLCLDSAEAEQGAFAPQGPGPYLPPWSGRGSCCWELRGCPEDSEHALLTPSSGFRGGQMLCWATE